MLTEFHRRNLAHMVHRRLCDRVNHRSTPTGHSRDTAGIYNAATLLFFHNWDCVFHAQKYAAHQNIHGHVKLIRWHFLDRSEYTAEASIVEHAIQTSPIFQSQIDRGLDLILLAHLDLLEQCRLAKFLGQRRSACFLHICDHNLGAFRGKKPYCPLTNTARAAGDDGNLSFKLQHFVLPTFVCVSLRSGAGWSTASRQVGI